MLRKATFRILFIALLVVSFLLIRSWLHNPSIPASSSPGNGTSPGGPNELERRQRSENSVISGHEAGRPSGLVCESQYFASWNEPPFQSCQVEMRNGYPVPDPRCTPGGVNPSISVDVLRNQRWRTRSIRNCESSEKMKHIAYTWYGIGKPRQNSDQNQVCELDHLVPLELGGADGLGNIWPQCGPDSVALNERYFKIKDRVEDYLADEVKSGRITLESAQRGIASDWTQYIEQADRHRTMK